MSTSTKSFLRRARLTALAAGVVIATAVAAQSGPIDKLAAHARMAELQADISRLRSGDGDAAAAQAELQAISASLGGDLPVASGQAAAGGGPRAAAPPPFGGTLTTSNFTQSTPTAIPTGPAVVTATVVVSGAGTYLWDLDLVTNLTHTFAADLDITLASPAGTVVTLTTDNGAGNDNVFNGTLWDDQANPAGQVPYVTNAGLVTDHPYVNLTTATPLVPEEGLTAFKGEDPNGTWTITVSDDLAGDGGSLDSFTLTTYTLPNAPTDTGPTTFTQSTPTAIPTGPAVVTSTVVVSGAGTTLSNLQLTTSLTHTFAADLDITLQGPTGIIATLTTDNGAGNDNVFNGTLWNVDANPAGQVPYTTNAGVVTDHPYVNLTTATPLASEESLGAFLGTDPNGTWTITISDDLAGDGGSLDSWSLAITTGTGGCTLTCAANITQANSPNQCGAAVTVPAPTTSGSCGVVTCTPTSGSLFPVGTTPVTCSSSVGNGTCGLSVTVNDTQAATITCPGPQSGGASAGTGATVVFPTPTATDNCPGVTTACVPPSGSVFPVGSSTSTCTATDTSGNTASCAIAITVSGLTSVPSLGFAALLLLALALGYIGLRAHRARS